MFNCKVYIKFKVITNFKCFLFMNSVKWELIKFFKLIKPTMPLIKYFIKVNHIHSNLLNKSLRILTLIDLNLFYLNRLVIFSIFGFYY